MDQATDQMTIKPASASSVGSTRLGLWLTAMPALHGLHASTWREGAVDERTEVRISKSATLVLGLAAVGPVIATQTRNIACLAAPLYPPASVMAPLAFAVCIGVSSPDRSSRAEQGRAGHAGQRQRMGGAIAMAAE